MAKKTIRFIKAHPVGIEVGKVVTDSAIWCDRMVANDYAEYVTEAEKVEETPVEVVETAQEADVIEDAVDETPTTQPETPAKPSKKKK